MIVNLPPGTGTITGTPLGEVFEQLRSIFDQSGLGVVLIGMPGIDKRIARYRSYFRELASSTSLER